MTSMPGNIGSCLEVIIIFLEIFLLEHLNKQNNESKFTTSTGVLLYKDPKNIVYLKHLRQQNFFIH